MWSQLHIWTGWPANTELATCLALTVGDGFRGCQPSTSFHQTGQIGQSDAAAQSNPGLSSLYILIFCAGTMKNNKANTGKLLQVFYIRKPEWTEDDWSIVTLVQAHRACWPAKEKKNNFAHLGMRLWPFTSVQRVDMKNKLMSNWNCVWGLTTPQASEDSLIDQHFQALLADEAVISVISLCLFNTWHLCHISDYTIPKYS